MTHRNRLQLSLLSLRATVFLVMLMWTLDKLVNPEHASAVFANFYGLEDFGSALLALVAGLELMLILAFVAGLWKRITYGAVFLLHAVSTLSSYAQYFAPWQHLLFFAAWPMLAACLTLYLLREDDVLLAIPLGHRRTSAGPAAAGDSTERV